MKKVDEGMSYQEIFNKVYLGLKSQGFRQSWSSELNQCAYRGDLDMKCAAGWLIPDEVYTPDLEGCSISFNPRAGNKSDPSSLFQKIGFVSELQQIHDLYQNTMKEELELYATKCGLEVPK